MDAWWQEEHEQLWIDIGAELLRVASEGLSVTEWLSAWATMDTVVSVLVCIKTMPLYYHEYPQEDDFLEPCAAVALRQVDELLEHQCILAQRWNPRAQAPSMLPPPAVAELKVLQRHMQDVVVLACARFTDQQENFERRGIPTQLEARLNTAFQAEVRNDIGFWSRLGNSKSHLFAKVASDTLKRRRGGHRYRYKAMLRKLVSEADVPQFLVPVSTAAPSDITAASAPPGLTLPLEDDLPLDHSTADSTENELLHEFDVAGELARVAHEALQTIATTIRYDESLQERLDFVKEILLSSRPDGDDLELRAAFSLVNVDELIVQHAGDSFMYLQLQLLMQHLMDLVVLSCRRLSNTSVQRKGIVFSKLMLQLEEALAPVTAMDGGNRRDNLVYKLQETMDYIFCKHAGTR